MYIKGLGLYLTGVFAFFTTIEMNCFLSAVAHLNSSSSETMEQLHLPIPVVCLSKKDMVLRELFIVSLFELERNKKL